MGTTADKYNEKLLFVVEHGDLSLDGKLFEKYGTAFIEWYGDDIDNIFSICKDDFVEWFKTRDVQQEEVEIDPEILESDLDEEISRIKDRTNKQ
jgi:hypothetical protein